MKVDLDRYLDDLINEGIELLEFKIFYYRMSLILSAISLFILLKEDAPLLLLVLSSLFFIGLAYLVKYYKYKYKESSSLIFNSFEDVFKFFNIKRSDKLNERIFKLYDSTDNITVDKDDDFIVLTFRKLNGTQYGEIVKIPISDIRVIYKPNLKEEELIIRYTDIILCKNYEE